MKCSVAMAVYNGSRYIRQQLDSIISQLEDNDELIISVDPSSDDTYDILGEYAKADARINITDGPGKGLMANFEHAICACTGDIILLSDQDDVWEADKLSKCRQCFEKPDVMVVLHDAAVYDAELENIIIPSFFSYKNVKTGIFTNIMRNSYMGCCMAFRKELLSIAVPFPKSIPMHDQWIGILGEMKGRTVLINEPLIKYRRHGNNMTEMKHAGIWQMLSWRISLVWCLLKRVV